MLAPLWAYGEEEEDSSAVFNAWQDQPSTATRAPRPLSQTAQNVTVITSKEIELLNAHTLADVLDTVPGIQLDRKSGPGITVATLIQSADINFCRVYVDGASISYLASNFPDVATIPAQIIDRIEIVKGAASTAWGSALGGVINVITKSPDKNRSIGGTATASIGERTTTDTRAELTGTTGKLGYYLSGGFLGSDGLLPGMQIGSNQAYAKLTYPVSSRSLLWGTYSYYRGNLGDTYTEIMDTRERADKYITTASLGFSHNFREGLDLEVLGHHIFRDVYIRRFRISNGELINNLLPVVVGKDREIAANVKLTWRTTNNLLVAGGDYNNQAIDQNSSDNRTITPFTRTVDRWGLYLNDTVTLGSFSLSPGLRLDHTQTNGDVLSYSLGATWQASESTLLRAYTGRGYGLPFLLPFEVPLSKVWTTQVGVESSVIPYLWVKGTLFRNMTWGAAVQQQLAMGSELEVRTTPIFHTSLGAGWTYTETTLTSDRTPVHYVPTQTVKLALRYDDSIFRGALTGNHVNWNPGPFFGKNHGGLIWDLHLGATLFKRENSSLELFFSGHNLFNGNFNSLELFPSPNRWFEGGIKVRF